MAILRQLSKSCARLTIFHPQIACACAKKAHDGTYALRRRWRPNVCECEQSSTALPKQMSESGDTQEIDK